MNEYLTLPDDKAEPVIFERLQLMDATMRVGYAQIGVMIREVEKRELWRHRLDPETGHPCRSLTRFIRVACPYSYSTAFAAKSDVKELECDLSVEDIADIPQSNFSTVIQLSSAVRKDPKVIEAAKHEKPEEFVAMIRVIHPNQHLEHRKSLRFNPPESAVEVIEEALKLAEDQGATTRDEALELIAVTARDIWTLEAEHGS